MNLDARSAVDAQREWDVGRRDEGYEKLVVTPAWELRLVREAPELQPYIAERMARCPDCGAGPPSSLLLVFFPKRIEKRPGEQHDVYLHDCGA